ncbi:DUF1793-domain-containing protein [Ascodesmis nigricans]|uniref:DUF1793-domain-containing protein n=1 Tax=Ascodesmis nigricans TaxID=341454 RepID=A0A4S2N447_9PEZI|nr:DUF1793-domain-containing protein [Ascodesmis nigricans]
MKLHLGISLLLVISPLFVCVFGSTLSPAVLPLAVRNPYLSLWLHSRDRNPWERWPMFWTGSTVVLGVMARVPGSKTAYPLLGEIQAWIPKETWKAPVYLGYQYDATTTSFRYKLEKDIEIELLFSSPITPDSTFRQSLPASYLEVRVSGQQDVDIYVEVNGMWVTNDYYHKKIVWDFSKTNKLQTWKIKKQDEQLFTEARDRSEWGTFYFTTADETDFTYQSAPARELRTRFATTGFLTNNFDTRYREVMNDEPLFAFAKHYRLSGTNKTSASTLYTLALTHDPIIQFESARGLTIMKPLWKSFFNNDLDMITFHYNDYANASASGDAFSKRVNKDAVRTVSSTYSDILTLSARQVLGAFYFTGTPQHPLIFQKEISSNGNMNTVDVIFPASPFLLYTNPDWLSYVIEPLLEHQNAGLYPKQSSMHDLGAHFPNATGHMDGNDEPMPVEECGNMLIMGLALVQRMDPKVAKHWLNLDGRYKLWKQWTHYLIDFGLIPAYQLSTDDFAGRLANQTNLAMKGLVGIKAMAGIAEAAGQRDDAKRYNAIADEYLPKFLEYAIAKDGTHTKLAYHWQGSWGSLYNQYGDALLCFHADDTPYIPPSLYRLQSKYYLQVMQRYGLPLDSRHLYTKSDWEMWIAAIVSEETRQTLVEAMGKWLNETLIDRPFTDIYDTEGKWWSGIYFMARPVVGGHFSILALDQSCGGKGFDKLKEIFEDTNGRDDEKELRDLVMKMKERSGRVKGQMVLGGGEL